MIVFVSVFWSFASGHPQGLYNYIHSFECTVSYVDFAKKWKIAIWAIYHVEGSRNSYNSTWGKWWPQTPPIRGTGKKQQSTSYFQCGRDLTEWAYWVLILQIRCIFSAKLSKRFDCRSQILSKRSFPGERILWENYPKVLTFSSVYPQGKSGQSIARAALF